MLCSDPYVKISIEGKNMNVYPHFVYLDDGYDEVYKTSVASKVVTSPSYKTEVHTLSRVTLAVN